MSDNLVILPRATQFTISGVNLQLLLDGKSIYNIERRLGKSLMALFMGPQGGMTLPPVNELLLVLQGANKTSGVTDDKLAQAFFRFIDDGHTTMELQEVVQGLLEDAGFFGKKKDAEKTDGESEEDGKEEPINFETPVILEQTDYE